MKQKKVALKILDAQFLDFNTGNELLDTAMFDMFLSLLSYIAQNEREKIRERQRQGVLLAQKPADIRDDQSSILLTQQIRKNA